MTRKCVLCKETNYKNSYSFFSAPKDAETRKKWQEAIGISTYVVTDETFVCSRHFKPGDIITHWVSGVPPHVVTIKYKKCRLRPGAVPNKKWDCLHNEQDDDNPDHDFDDFDPNRHWGNDRNDRKYSTFGDDREEVFLIPRADNIVTYTSMDNQNNTIVDKSDEIYESTEIEEYIAQTMEQTEGESESMVEEHVEGMVLDDEREELEIIQSEELESDGTVYLKNEDDQSIVYVQDINYQTGVQVKEINDDNSFVQVSHMSIGEVVEGQEGEAEGDGENDDNGVESESLEMWTMQPEIITPADLDDKESKIHDNTSMDLYDPLAVHEADGENNDNEDIMLFEDLLEVYTEVPLPRGWTSMVISGGRATTVIYAHMSMTQTGVPYVQKQVFLKSDMTLQCSAMGTPLNPRSHNLVRSNRHLKVHTLLDVEEFIEEFHQRVICEGLLDKVTPGDIYSTLACQQDSKWRHIECPIIMNNSSTRCSKCGNLNLQANRRKMKKPPQTAESAELLKKERTIYLLEKKLMKVCKQNQRITLMKNNPKSLLEILVSLDMPEIQKLMIKECIKGDDDQTTTDFDETWIFLSLLIYIESPRIYRFLMLNNYMNLPDIKIMRRYLEQIKTDDQFYKLFQQTVEPYQYSELEDEKEPT